MSDGNQTENSVKIPEPASLHIRDFVSGRSARRYRQRLAALSDRPDDSMLTQKFRLDLPEGMKNAVGFQELRSLYSIIEGVEKGSLTYYLFSVILSGFRIFENASGATTFASQSSYDDAGFSLALKNATGLDLPAFVPSEIYKRLAKGVRARNGKDASFSKEVIVAEYARELLAGVSSEQIEDAKTLLGDVAQELVNQFNSDAAQARTGQGKTGGKKGDKPWAWLKKNLVSGCMAVDRALSRYGQIPSVAGTVESAYADLPKNSTIAFDVSSRHIPMNDVMNPYFAVATVASRYEGEEVTSTELRNYVQKNLTTNTNSGLSWLFGVGLDYIRSTSLDMLCAKYGVPPERRESMRQVQEAALAIPSQEWLVNDTRAFSYNVFRSSLGGHIDSWVANYLNRLFELQVLLDGMPDSLELPVSLRHEIYGDFLDTTDCRRDEIEGLCDHFNSGVRYQLEVALKNLMGRGDVVTEKDVLEVRRTTALINRLYAIRQQLKNALVQAEKDNGSVWKKLNADTAPFWHSWDKLQNFPKLNQLTGGVPDVKKELETAQGLFHLLVSAQRRHFEKICAWAKQQGKPLAPFDVLQAAEDRALKKRPLASQDNEKQITSGELALRRLLHRVGNIVRLHNDEYAESVRKWFVNNPLFSTTGVGRKVNRSIFRNLKDCNKYFFNHLGRFYVSPFSTSSRHESYSLKSDVLEHPAAVAQSLGDLLNAQPVFSDLSMAGQDTWLRLNRVWMAYCLSGLQCAVPRDVASLELPDGLRDSVPDDLSVLMNEDFVEPSVLQRAFNLYASLLSGFQTLLRRERFYLRTKFSWVDNNELIYVPKDTEWRLPERYRHSETWQRVFDSGVIVYKNNGCVDVWKTFDKISETDIPRELIPLLRQLPHDWCWRLPFREPANQGQVSVLSFSKEGAKGMVLKGRRVSAGNLARLIGPSSMKGLLDDLVESPLQKTVSDMTLLVDQPVRQSVLKNEGIHLEDEECQLTLAIPLAQKQVSAADSEKAFPFTRVVGIDQGEAGLAYAVFDLDDIGTKSLNNRSGAVPVALGAVRIPSIRRLIKGVRRYRKGRQQTQKFNQKFDSTMFTLRENVTGDVCGVIVGLMHRYHAFPVLEYQVRNLESGSKQLELVYKAVNAHFLFNNVPMQDSTREAWWYECGKWPVPDIYRKVNLISGDEQKTIKPVRSRKKTDFIEINGEKYRSLNLFPGTAVSAAMTSRICSCCGRNVYSLLPADENERLYIAEGGVLNIDGEIVRLYQRPTKEMQKKAARRNERAHRTVPVAAGEYTVKEIRRMLGDNMRRQPKSLQSKDTSQSRYFCVFNDCERHNQAYHADVNAAINIGRRFLSETVKNVS